VLRASKLSGLALIFALGALAAWTLGASGRTAETTTVDTAPVAETTTAVEATTAAETTTAVADTTTAETATTAETTTEATPGTTVVATTTLQITTTRILPVPTSVETTSSGSDDDTPAWVWVLIAILAAGLVALIALLARRGRGGGGLSVEDRRRHLDAAVASWTAQGWAIESQTADSAVLRRDAESMLVSVDQAGHVSTRPLPPT
jgi:hypothetical protein